MGRREVVEIIIGCFFIGLSAWLFGIFASSGGNGIALVGALLCLGVGLGGVLCRHRTPKDSNFLSTIQKHVGAKRKE